MARIRKAFPPCRAPRWPSDRARAPSACPRVTGNHWLQIQLQGTTSNRDGIGARVKVRTGSLQQIDEPHSGRSYQSDFGKRLHFGLGNKTHIDEIKVEWIGGGIDILRDLEADQLYIIKEGEGLVHDRSAIKKP